MAFDATGQSSVYRILRDIWKIVLSVDDVDFQDDFYDLGGDSLTAVRVSQLARERGVIVSPVQVLEAESLGRLAELAMGNARSDGAS